jgi:hypothetical protein
MIPREEIHIVQMRFDPPRIIRLIDSPAVLAVVFGVIVYVSAIVGLSG